MSATASSGVKATAPRGRGVYGALFLDPMFKRVFCNVANACRLISALLRLERAEVKSVEQRTIDESDEVNEGSAAAAGAGAASSSTAAPAADFSIGDRTLSMGREVRRVVFDAYCVLNGHEVVVEMQNAPHVNFLKRMWGYMSYAVAVQWQSSWGKQIAEAGGALVGPDALFAAGGISSGDGSAAGAVAAGAGQKRKSSSASEGSTGSQLGGRGAAYAFRPVYTIGITNFFIRDQVGGASVAIEPAGAKGSGSAVQCFRMGFDDSWYRDGERKDASLRAVYADLAAHVIVQLPYAPKSEVLRSMTAAQAGIAYSPSDLWATLLRDACMWVDEDVPPVFQEAPYRQVLEEARLSRYNSDDRFLAEYNTAMERMGDLKDAEQYIHQMEGQLAAKDDQLAAKDDQLAAKDDQLAAKDAQIAELTAKLARR